jgi:hypothetical protein
VVQVVLELGLEVTEFHAGNNSTCDLGHIDHGVISSDTEMSQGWVRAAIHRHLIESYELNNVSKQKTEIINLVDVPLARWNRAEQEYADSVIRRHFDEDR